MDIVKIPFSAGTLGKNEGCKEAPNKIVELLKQIYVNEDKKNISFDIKESDLDFSNLDKIQNQLCRLD